MTTEMLASFDGRVLVPESPVDLPVGRLLEVRVTERKQPSAGGITLAVLAERAAELPANPDAPTDGASRHDHYLFGVESKK